MQPAAHAYLKPSASSPAVQLTQQQPNLPGPCICIPNATPTPSLPLLQRIPNLNLNLTIHNTLDQDTAQVLNNPVRTSLPDLLNRMRRGQCNHLVSGGLTSLNSTRRILQHDNVRRALQSDLLRSELVAPGVRLTQLDVLGDDEVFRVCEAQHAEPAVDQGAGTGCHDAPFRGGAVEGVEEVAAAGDFDGVGAPCLGDAAFDVLDVYEKGVRIYRLYSSGLRVEGVKAYSPSWPWSCRIVP